MTARRLQPPGARHAVLVVARATARLSRRVRYFAVECGLERLVRPRTALIALLATLCTAAAALPSDAQALRVGIADDAILLNGTTEEAREAIADWQRIGIDTVRVQVVWARIAPEPRSYDPPPDFDPANHLDYRYNWNAVDRAVRLLADAGIQPLLMLDGPPPLWGSSRPRVGNPRYLPSPYYFGKFAAAVAARYGNVVDEYILWNEPNLPVWLQPQGLCNGKRCTPVSPHTYRYMVRAAYPEIHAADATSRVLVGALAPAGGNLTSKNANMRPLQFLRAFGCVDALLQPVTSGPCATFEPAPADGIAYHPHSTKHPPHEGYANGDNAALASLKDVERIVDLLQSTGRLGTAGQPPLGFWLDEYAYQTNPPDKLRGVTPGRQDRYLQQAAYLAWRNPRVQLLAQYLWQDERVGGGKRYTGWQSGLIDSEGDPKPALAHFDDPLWVDFERGVVWGQIRPGGDHDVEIQIRRPGAGTAWEPLARLHTAWDGSFFLRTQPEQYAAYRAVWGDGRTSAAIVAGPLSDASAGPERTEISTEGLLVERRAAATTPGAPVPRSFAGLSMEWRSVPDYIGTGGFVNPIFATLVQTLSRAGNGPPTLRFGGESTDHTWWNPVGAPPPPGITNDITPPWLAHLAAWVRTAKTPLVLGLNMGMKDPAQAAAMAAAARSSLPPGSIRAFELGNEPDLYPTPRTYSVGRNVRARSQKRPTGYGYPEYRREVSEHVAAIRPAAPDVGLAGGGFASGAWDDLQDDVLAREWAVKLWSAHAYPLQTCDPDVRRRGGARYIPKLLAGGAYTAIIDRMRHLTAVATSHGAKVLLSETNSAICGGLRGVSDTFASALWGTDLLFGLAAEGVRNVDFHTWTGSIYGPLEFERRFGVPIARVRPLFYAMLLFSRGAPAGARQLAVSPNPPGGRLKTWGTIDAAGTRRFVVVNKDAKAGRKLVLGVPGARGDVRVERLVAPSLKSQNNVTFGGLGWRGSTTDGIPKGTRQVERHEARDGTLRLVMPRASAALVVVPGAPLPATRGGTRSRSR